jgi:hypothetical protein
VDLERSAESPGEGRVEVQYRTGRVMGGYAACRVGEFHRCMSRDAKVMRMSDAARDDYVIQVNHRFIFANCEQRQTRKELD